MSTAPDVPLQIEAAPYPGLDARAFVTNFDCPLGSADSPAWLSELLAFEAPAPVARTEATRAAVRTLLRHGGYRPSGRGKPASEYLVRAAQDGTLGPINPAVDCCNVVSLHSGLPISVVDLDLTAAPLRIAVGAPDDAYVFNRAGQVIAVAGLLCLFDAAGPCANPVKDAQRTKTSSATRTTLSVVWSAAECGSTTAAALAFYQELLRRCGAKVNDVAVVTV